MPLGASAHIVITEIMYDVEGTDSDREWIEVQNTGSETVNVTEWKFFESNSNHGITAHQGGEMLSPGAYAVIVDSPAKFLADWPSFSGSVFDSSFALNNTGETLVLRCCGKELTDRDSVTYNATGGGAGDGFSLHRSGSSIAAATPSPGSGAIVAPAPKTEPPPPPPQPAPKTEPPPTLPQQVTQKTEVKQTDEKKQESAATPAVHTSVVAPASLPVPEPTVVIQEEQPAPPKKSAKNKKIEPIVIEDGPVEESEMDVTEERGVSHVAAANTTSPSENSLLWWLGAAAVSIFGAGGAYMAGRSQRGPKTIRTKDGWQIEEVE